MADDIGALRAIAHPVRLRILSLLTGAELSAAEVARELGLTHANASYHLRQLLAAGEVVEAGQERIRGGVAKRYRYPHERPPRRGATTTDDEVLYVRAVTTELERRVRERAGRQAHSSDLEGWVDPELWAETLETLRALSARLHAAARAPRTPGTVHVSVTSWAFRLDEPRDDP